MSQPILNSYNQIIAHTIEQALALSVNAKIENVIAGFCRLQGPTGGGKSSSLYRSPDGKIPASLEFIKSKGLQAILVTHRWNILHDIYESATSAKDSSGNPLLVSILYAQDETVVSAVSQRALPHEQGVQKSDLPDTYKAIEDIHGLGVFRSNADKEALVRACHNVAAIARNVEYKKKNPDSMGVLLEREEQELRKLCGFVERTLLGCMSSLEKAVKYASKHHGKTHELTAQAKEKLRLYRENKWVRRIFPAIAWHDDKQHLLVLTTQKLFASFYDGKQKVRMSSGQLAGKVVFVDEFDYQADILQTLLAQSQMVQEPPECIGQLLEGGKRLLARMQFVTAEPIPELYSELKQLIGELEEDLTSKGVDLNQSRALVMPLKQYEAGVPFEKKYLFRSDHLVTSEPLQLQQKPHGFEVKSYGQSDEASVDVGDFLRVMEKYIRRFSLLLSQFATDESEAYEYLVRLNRLLFDPANDYRPSYYSTALPSLSLFSLPRTSLPELEALSRSNRLPNTQTNMFGLTTWLLTTDEAEADIDPLRIKIKRALLPTTPEGLMVSLSSRNLVFALSATSYIERGIGHFDIRWIESALRYLAQARNPQCTESFLGDSFEERPEDWFKKPIPYLQTDEDKQLQMAVIRSLVEDKSEKRRSTLKTTIHDFDDAINAPVFQEAKLHLNAAFFEAEHSDYKYEYRQSVLFKLLHVLHLAANEPQHKGHLAFVNSVKYLRKWLISDTAENSRMSADWLEMERLTTGVLSSFDDVFIPLAVNGKSMMICLLNAEAQKREGFERAYQAAFDSGRTVVVMTQTASATNGINLDYSLPNSQGQIDLTSLFIIESKHFYFSPWDSNDADDEMSHAGFQLRNLEKLVRRSEFSRKQQRQFIMPLMNNSVAKIQELNKLYKGTNDYVKNLAADVQQQVGRIERAWTYVPHVAIHLSDDVAGHLRNYGQLTVCTNNRNWVSNLNNQLIDDLTHSEDATVSNFLALLKTRSQDGSAAVDIIDNKLVSAIRDARQGKGCIEDISGLWHELGRAVLQHDLQWMPQNNMFGITEPLCRWACFERPKETKVTGETWYDPKSWQFFAKRAAGLIKYNPQTLYEVVNRQPAISDWFNRKGFRTSFQPFANDIEEQFAFHPVVIQRILQGRIGEEGIRALLSDKQLATKQDVYNHELFELYDFEIANADVFVDAKFWSIAALEQSDEGFEQWLASGKRPEFAPLGLIKKLEKIRQIRGENAILVIANLLTGEDCSLSGFSEVLEPVKVENASILFLPGCLVSDGYQMTSGFKWFSKIVWQRMREQG